MKTIGQILKDVRVEKRYSLYQLEGITKIKSSFIEDIEKEKWERLPAFPVVLGFVKSLAGALGINENTTAAILKRDYPPKKIAINPKPDVSSKKVIWGPKITFLAGVALVLVALFGYLGFQYYKFVSPPSLSVESPKEGQVIIGRNVLVFGSTDTDAKITVNNQPVLVTEDGKFSDNIEVVVETHEIVVKATSRTGKETVIVRKIEVKK